MNKVISCPYCDAMPKLVDGTVIYPHRSDLSDLNFYMCENGHDRAYVGCHKGTTEPLGRLADKDLRHAKSQAHKAFDPIWRVTKLASKPFLSKGNRFKPMKRGKAYSWLASQLGINKNDCHIGMFDAEMCQRVIEVSNKYRRGE